METGLVSFSHDWEHRSLPKLWWGEDRLALADLKRLSPEDFGLAGGYYGFRGRIYFVLPCSETEDLDMSKGIYVAGSFNGWQAAVGERAWRMRKGLVKGERCHVLSIAQEVLDAEEAATFKFVTGTGQWLEVPERVRNTHIDGFGIKNYLFSSHRSGRHLFRFRTPLPLNKAEGRLLFFGYGKEVDSIRLSPGIFLKTLGTEARLGAFVEEGRTTFRLFAPRAARVLLYLFEEAEGPEGKPMAMSYTGDTVWELTLEGDYHGWYYHYTVEGQETDEVGYFDPEFRIPDPYARAVCGPLGPGIVVRDSFFERSEDGFSPPAWHDLVILEAHVRDLTAQAPVELLPGERMGFRGLRKWALADDFYPSMVGVNAIELQPVHEFDTLDPDHYGWGYMPVNYFSPASQYARDPSKLEQVREFRELVESLHGRGLAVILDVVYNHVGEPNFLQYLDREYYFLLDENGNYQNHSGCGNTLDGNAPMVRRLIRDSLVHWIEAYGVDGFRFDLGELIGSETLAWLEAELKAVKPGIILIAEPWSFRGHIAHELRETGFASWNDGYREAVREYVQHHRQASDLRYFMLGSQPDWSRFPAQTVNYVASHDDRCWIDKITENGGHDGTHPTGNDRRRTHLMISILMMSAGIPMLLAGDDMLKSKGGVNNTYLRGDLNAIPYVRMTEFPGTVAYVRAWIRFRISSLGRLVRLDGFPPDAYFSVSENGKVFGCILNADRSAGDQRLLFVVNPGHSYEELRFMEVETESFVQLADTERWGDPFLEPPYYIRCEDRVLVPSLSCGLFVDPA